LTPMAKNESEDIIFLLCFCLDELHHAHNRSEHGNHRIGTVLS